MGNTSPAHQTTVRNAKRPATISTFRSRILEKLNLENDAQIMQFAVRNGLLDDGGSALAALLAE